MPKKAANGRPPQRAARQARPPRPPASVYSDFEDDGVDADSGSFYSDDPPRSPGRANGAPSAPRLPAHGGRDRTAGETSRPPPPDSKSRRRLPQPGAPTPLSGPPPEHPLAGPPFFPGAMPPAGLSMPPGRAAHGRPSHGPGPQNPPGHPDQDLDGDFPDDGGSEDGDYDDDGEYPMDGPDGSGPRGPPHPGTPPGDMDDMDFDGHGPGPSLGPGGPVSITAKVSRASSMVISLMGIILVMLLLIQLGAIYTQWRSFEET